MQITYKNSLILLPKIWRSPSTLVVSRTLGIVWDASGMILTRYQRTLAATGAPWWLVGCVSVVFSSAFHRFLLIFMKINRNQGKSTKMNENQQNLWKLGKKTADTQTTGYQEAPSAASVLWYQLAIIPKAPHAIPSVLEATSVLGKRQILVDRIKLFLYTH